MSDIVKICKIHGQLSVQNIQKMKNKYGSFTLVCKICRKESHKKCRDKNKSRIIDKQCKAPGCTRNVKNTGGETCKMHYMRWYTNKSYNRSITTRFYQPDVYPEGFTFLCKNHGYLIEEQVYIRKDRNKRACRQCRNQSTYESYKKKRDLNPTLAKEKKRNYRTKKQFGITSEQYNQMLISQNYVCAICKRTETRIHHRTNVPTKLAIDHCHLTGKIRGLLCSTCNMKIGGFNDSIEILKSAIEYLEKYQ